MYSPRVVQGSLRAPPTLLQQAYPLPKCQERKPIPIAEIRRKGWRDQVVKHFQYLCKDDPNLENPVRKLVLAKDAIRNVYEVNNSTGEFFHNLTLIARLRISSALLSVYCGLLADPTGP